VTYIPMQNEQLRDRDLQRRQLTVLKKIETHLSHITDEEIKEEDTNVD